MIYGIGTDITEISRVSHIYQKHGYHFSKNILTPKEHELLAERNGSMEFFAGRWAAKEAFSKALHTGMCIECAFVEIEILSDERGCPAVKLYGETAKTVEKAGITRIHVSISHEKSYAVATVLLECAGK